MPTPFGQKDESSILRFRQQLGGAIERSKQTDLAAIEAGKQRQIDMAINEHLTRFKQADDGTFQSVYTAGKQTVPNLLQLGPRGVVAAKEVADYVNIYPKPKQPATRIPDTKFDWVSQVGPEDKVEYQKVPGFDKKQPVLKKVIVGADGTMKDTGARKLAGAIGDGGSGSGGGTGGKNFKPSWTVAYTNHKGELIQRSYKGTPLEAAATLGQQKLNREEELKHYPIDQTAILNNDYSSVHQYREQQDAKISDIQAQVSTKAAEANKLANSTDPADVERATKLAQEAQQLQAEATRIQDDYGNLEDKIKDWKQLIMQEADANQYLPEGAIPPHVQPKSVAKPPAAQAAPTTGAPVKVSTPEERDKLPSGTLYIGPDGKTRRRK